MYSTLRTREEMLITYINELVDVLDVHLISSNASDEVHKAELRRTHQSMRKLAVGAGPYSSDDPVICVLLALRQGADTEEKL